MNLILAVAAPDERAVYQSLKENSAASYAITEVETPEQLAFLYNQLQPQCIIMDSAFADSEQAQSLDRLMQEAVRNQCGIVLVLASEKINTLAANFKKHAHSLLCAEHLDANQLHEAIQFAAADARNALPETEERYKAIVEALPEILFTAMPNGRIDFINQQFYDYTGLTGGEYQDFGWFESLHPEDAENVSRSWRESVETGRTFNAEYRFRRADGHYRWFRCRAVPLRDTVNGISKWFGICMDITEQKRLEQERENLLTREMQARDMAEAANRAKDEFLAMVSHELRAPLNAVLGWINILRSQEIDETTLNHALETIERSAKAQATLIEDLVDSAMIATGKMRIKMERVNLVTVVQSALDVVVPAAEAKAIFINFKVTASNTQVLGDASRLQQVFWNLLSNAVKFTPEGGSIDVTVQNFEGNAQIIVSDSGRGINVEMLPFVFERFQQADVTRTRRFGGLGLGLSLVKQLVELHGGLVQATSAGEGQGATFTVSLPLRARPSGVLSVSMLKALSQVEERGNRALSFNGLRVLVVDDDADAREISAIVLRQQGAKVMQADSAREAFHLLTSSVGEACPDILISDIGMPEEDGYSLIRRIRALPPEQGGNIPAVALTAFTSAEDRRRALETGFQVHLAKPIEPNELIKVIGTLANRVNAG